MILYLFSLAKKGPFFFPASLCGRHLWQGKFSSSLSSATSYQCLCSVEENVSHNVHEDGKSIEDMISLLKNCIRSKCLSHGRRVHQQIVDLGIQAHYAIQSCLVDMYLKCGSLSEARSIVSNCQVSSQPLSVFWWNTTIKEHVKHGLFADAVSLYKRMLKVGVKPDNFTFPFVLKACGELSALDDGKEIHRYISTDGFVANVFVYNALISMYARCGCIKNAHDIFNAMPADQRDVVSWNSIVAAYVQGGNPETGLQMFSRMQEYDEARLIKKRLIPDRISLVNVLPACASLRYALGGKQIHGYAIRKGLSCDLFVNNAIIDMYCKCSLMLQAVKVFNRMATRDVVSWNAMVTGYSQSGDCESAVQLFNEMQADDISLDVVTWSAVIAGYAQRGQGNEALTIFRKMQLSGAKPNAITLISLLSACASVGALVQGKEVHGHILKYYPASNICEENAMLNNALIDMYAKCKLMESAEVLFNSTGMSASSLDRNVVTWTVMIGGHVQNGNANNALRLFSDMLHSQAKPNSFTISCALMACADLSALREGKQIHAFVYRNSKYPVPFVSNCLIDMYSKCGTIETARKVFDRMPQRNEVSWTSMMTGYGVHGRGNDAIGMFHQMQRDGFVPDDVTFLVLLYACSHSGLLDEGRKYFERMTPDYGVVAGAEHYACMVDLLGRAGHLDEVQELIASMPTEPSYVVWVALLSACRIHKNVELGEYAAKRLLELDSDGTDGSFTLLSNIYANAGRWKDVARIRGLMRSSGIKKRPGCSWVQGRGGTTVFFAGDYAHPRSVEIYVMLKTLLKRIREIGYVPETSFALHDVDEEEKDSLLSEHSEKLALAFALLEAVPGTPIRITKNLRVCGDCHSAIKFISQIVDHEIIVRDSSRFHHFCKGSCSCKGFW
ncbi:pentatricopeptide repeat-containing protein At5g16860 isoform X1 [Nymphaea colorata]|nr:pentatricopeptide repeat-containing protein At5g16860 isoform X1 [Nymphaea colorata]